MAATSMLTWPLPKEAKARNTAFSSAASNKTNAQHLLRLDGLLSPCRALKLELTHGLSGGACHVV